MATYTKYQNYVLLQGQGVVKQHAAGDTYKVMLSNAAPNVATHTIRSDATEIGAGTGGYTVGGYDIQNDYTVTAGTGTMTAVDVVITASGGTIGPFRYAIIFDDTVATPVKPLMCYFDYLSSITLNDTETFTVHFGASLSTLA